ncbi:CAT1 [Symbiodinium microadriaticum]|nr:CAT1 [Symbiodinium microadriaticum]CAE7937830.1 CAT1 [Symbiodinium sp. KB8]
MLAPAPPAAFAQLRLGQALAPAQLRYSYRALRQNLPKPPYRSRRARRRAAQLEPPSREGESGSSEAYGLVDLVALSVASTVGSGVFSLAGRVASQEAGPAVVLSLGIGALGCLLSATAYAELSSRVVAAGSVYAYAQATGLGRSTMAVAALCLIVEYSWSCAAVSVDWSGKLLRADFGFLSQVSWDPGVLLVLFCTALLARGTKTSRLFTNVSTAAKLGLIFFLMASALLAFDVKNLQPFIPEEYGISGVLRGATDSFFGFLGFDAVCALALDTKDARRVVPSALFLGLFVSGGLTCLAGFVLVAAVPAARLDPAAGFVSAFEILGNDFAARVVTVGELLVLPVVAFGCLLPLGRLLCCLAEDGFLPPQLARRDSADQPLLATLLGGTATALCAGLVPFEDLNDICSAAVLCCFILASISAVMARQEGALRAQLRELLAAFAAFAFAALFLCSPRWTTDAALAPTLLRWLGAEGPPPAWDFLALVAAAAVASCAIRAQKLAKDPPDGLAFPVSIHLVSVLGSTALLTTLPVMLCFKSVIIFDDAEGIVRMDDDGRMRRLVRSWFVKGFDERLQPRRIFSGAGSSLDLQLMAKALVPAPRSQGRQLGTHCFLLQKEATAGRDTFHGDAIAEVDLERLQPLNLLKGVRSAHALVVLGQKLMAFDKRWLAALAVHLLGLFLLYEFRSSGISLPSLPAEPELAAPAAKDAGRRLAKVEIIDGKFHRDGQITSGKFPGKIIGIGGNDYAPLAHDLGFEAFRTWGLDQLPWAMLEARKQDFKVMAGLDMTRDPQYYTEGSEHCFDNLDQSSYWQNAIRVILATVNRFKTDPNMLMWLVGNELEIPIDIEKGNDCMWKRVNWVARKVKDADPDHPVGIALAGIASPKVTKMSKLCPEIDVLGTNIYGNEIRDIGSRLRAAGWTKPWAFTECGA